MNDLKPCPQCCTLSAAVERVSMELWCVRCAECNALGRDEQSVEEAIAAWNRRAPASDASANPAKGATTTERASADSVGPGCNPHPDAPHGFVRNASHSEGRYVCECEGWEGGGEAATVEGLMDLVAQYTKVYCDSIINETNDSEVAKRWEAVESYASRLAGGEVRALTDERIFALAKEHFGERGHDLIWATSPEHAEACGLGKNDRWTAEEVRPSQTIALCRAIEAEVRLSQPAGDKQ